MSHPYRNIREMAGERLNAPVCFVEGNRRPKSTGSKAHYTTRGGSVIHYPSAYSRTGWSNMLYKHSTIAVVVGIEWAKNNDVKAWEFFNESRRNQDEMQK